VQRKVSLPYFSAGSSIASQTVRLLAARSPLRFPHLVGRCASAEFETPLLVDVGYRHRLTMIFTPLNIKLRFRILRPRRNRRAVAAQGLTPMLRLQIAPPRLRSIDLNVDQTER
jgi:hypothetical protein